MTTPSLLRAFRSVILQARRRTLAAGSLLILGVTALAASQTTPVTPEPQGKPQAPQAPGPAPQGQAQAPPAQQPGGAASQQAASQGTVRIGDTGNVVRLSAAATQVVLTMSGLGAAVDKLSGTQLSAFASTLGIADTVRLGEPAAHKVKITPQQFLGRAAAGSLSWLVMVETEGLPPNAIEKRLTTLSIGPATARDLYPLEFALTNQPPSTAQYDVTAPGHDWMVSRSEADNDRTYPLMIVNRSEPISGLRVSQVSLKRSDDGRSIRFDEVKLLQDTNGTPGSIDLQPNETKTVFLRLDASDSVLPYGSFAGQVQLVSSGTAPKAVPLTARVTSGAVRFAGALLVLLGLLTSLITTTRLQPRLARLQALRPATLVRDMLVAFSSESTKLAGGDVKGIVAEADRQAARLETSTLDAAGLLPLAISVAGGATGNAATQLQTLLNDVSGRLAGLMLLRDTVVQLASKHPKAGRSDNVQNAIDALNAAAPQATTAAAAHAAMAPILDTLRAAPGAEREAVGAIPARITTQQLDFMLHQTANVAAIIWAAVSLAIGVTYVYSDVDFGTPVDLLGMFLWGLGLTAFGAGIQQLTPRQVATQIGVVVPKSATDPPRV